MLMKPWQEPGSVILFEDDKQMRFWLDHTYREPPDEEDADG